MRSFSERRRRYYAARRRANAVRRGFSLIAICEALHIYLSAPSSLDPVLWAHAMPMGMAIRSVSHLARAF